MTAPICLFTYTRLAETRQTIDALKKNYLAKESDLYIFSDAAKNDKATSKVEEVREYIKHVSGFKSVEIIEAVTNKGLANSIISGVSLIIEKYGRVIVLEDDLITAPNFLSFMNQALDYYKNSGNIHSVAGFTFEMPILKNYPKDFYLGFRASSWGWGTWYDKWKQVDWEVKDYKSFIYNPIKHIQFMKGGSDLPQMLWKQMNGKIDSWAVRWCFHQYQNDLLTVFPSKSKIMNIGFGEAATHTNTSPDRFKTVLDSGEQKAFTFEKKTNVEREFARQFRNKFSVFNRLKYKFKN